LKPENILIGIDGYLKLTDFGISKILEDKNSKTKSIYGTPQYVGKIE
jgi:serine/threonine protein kinase